MILRVQITFQNDQNPYYVILKVPGTFAMEKAAENCGGEINFLTPTFSARFPGMHNSECDFYNFFAPKFNFLPLPKIFGTKFWTKTENGLILMEDLSKKGKLQFLTTSINLAQIKEMTSLLAKMHKTVLMMDEKEWKGKFTKNQSTFADMIQMTTTQVDKFLKNSNKFKGWYSSSHILIFYEFMLTF